MERSMNADINDVSKRREKYHLAFYDVLSHHALVPHMHMP